MHRPKGWPLVGCLSSLAQLSSRLTEPSASHLRHGRASAHNSLAFPLALPEQNRTAARTSNQAPGFYGKGTLTPQRSPQMMYCLSCLDSDFANLAVYEVALATASELCGKAVPCAGGLEMLAGPPKTRPKMSSSPKRHLINCSLPFLVQQTIAVCGRTTGISTLPARCFF